MMDAALLKVFFLSYSSQAAADREIFSLSLLQGGIRLAIIGCCLKLGIDHLDGPFIASSPTVSRSPYVQSPPRAPLCRSSLDLAGATFDKHAGWFAVIGAD